MFHYIFFFLFSFEDISTEKLRNLLKFLQLISSKAGIGTQAPVPDS